MVNQTGLVRKDEMRNKNKQKSTVYKEVHERFERVFNKADCFSNKSSQKGFGLCVLLLIAWALSSMVMALVLSNTQLLQQQDVLMHVLSSSLV